MVSRSKLWSRLTGDYQSAGDKYLSDGKLQSAALMYSRAGKPIDAARLYFRAGCEREALDLLERIGPSEESGELLYAENNFRDAIRHFERAGCFWRAAEVALESQQPLRAAKLFEQNEAWERAARCYEQAGAFDEAQVSWERYARQAKGELAESELRKIQVRRAQLLRRVGRLREAAILLGENGYSDRAAELWLKAGEHERALEALLTAGQPRRAITLLERVGDAIDSNLRARVMATGGQHAAAGEIFESMGELGQAVDAFEAAGEWLRAAQLAERAEDPGRAGRLYEQIQRHADAARCYSESGQIAAAAGAWRDAGEPRRAAELFLEVAQPIDAAEAYLAAGDQETALGTLRDVEEGPDRLAATLRLAPMLIETGDAADALDLLGACQPQQKVAGKRRGEGGGAGTEKDESSLEWRYWLARTQEELGRLGDALESWSRLVELDPSYRDVIERLEQVRARNDEAREALQVNSTQPIEHLAQAPLLDGRYELGEELGRGGMSRVYRAVDRREGRVVALKMLHGPAVHDEDAQARLMTEFEVCHRIRHPNVIRLFEIGRWQESVYVTMELLEGVMLSELLEAGEKLSPTRALEILRSVLCGLEAAHRASVIHRDLKPANVAVTPDVVKVMDFGIAYAGDASTNVTRTGQVVGSPMYMAPEQIQGHPLDGRCDLYSFGILTFTALVGYEPFRAPTPMAVSLKHLKEAPPSLIKLKPELPPEWGAFVGRLLAKRREDRFVDASAALAALDSLPIPVDRAVGRR